MVKRIRPFIPLLLLTTLPFWGQEQKVLIGKIVAPDEVEGIHVLNESLGDYAVSAIDGTFEIRARVSDTIAFSSIKYAPKSIIITEDDFFKGTILVDLEEFVNVLDEVVIGKILTGDLNLDLDVTQTKRDINFYDVGIPGNINLPLTQKERRLHEADAGRYIYYGFGFALNLHKILNRVSGRTKKLKELVELEDRDQCMTKTRREFSSILFEEGKYKDEEIIGFFFYASEDPRFSEHCLTANKMNMFNYLKLKQGDYLAKLNSTGWEKED